MNEWNKSYLDTLYFAPMKKKKNPLFKQQRAFLIQKCHHSEFWHILDVPILSARPSMALLGSYHFMPM